MSVPIIEPTASTPELAPTAPITAKPEAPAQETDWKTESRKWEARAKDNSAAAARLAEIEESSKTEAQKLADQLTAARREALDAKREAFAASRGIPANLITGDAPEQWEAAAAEALSWREASAKLPAAPSAVGLGNVGEQVGALNGRQLTDADLDRMTPAEINRARRDGRLDSILGKRI